MIKIIGISGSLRKNSINSGLLRSVSDSISKSCIFEIGSIQKIPLYNEDIEKTQGIPQSVEELKNKISNSDGIIIATPENNNSIPGVLKNVLDWLTRPPKDRKRVFHNLPVGIMGATPGNFGTAFSQYALLPILRILGTQVWSGKLMWVSDATKKFDKSGNLINDSTKNKLETYMNEFVQFVKCLKK